MPNKSYDRLLDEHLLTLIRQGSHDALTQLIRRYHKHSLHLTKELLILYPETGITRKELMAVCDERLPFIVAKYNPLFEIPFLTFWRKSAENIAMDYIIENSYNGGAMAFRGVISFDEIDDESISYGERIAEGDDDKIIKKRILEIKEIIINHQSYFTGEELSVLFLVLDGYSIREIEKIGIMSRTTLYLTFNTLIKKVINLRKRALQNK